uniref:lysozyme inhibitor LprI family protein n=1 Tax=Phenylobacterium sp. TaxID=1871053 RepID=UPI0035AE25B3
GDPELAAADRRLARAYNRAVASGVPARALRAEQDDWLSIRDDAARRSPDAVASVYEQRIRELNDLAEGY